MTTKYSPPGYLDFETLLSKEQPQFIKIYRKRYIKINEKENYYSHQKIYSYDLFIIDEENSEELQKILENPEEAINKKFSVIQYKLTSQDWSDVKKDKLLFAFQKCDGDKFIFTQNHNGQIKKHAFNRNDLFALIHVSEYLKRIRDGLCTGAIKTFVLYENQLQEITESVWIDAACWYRLIIDGCYRRMYNGPYYFNGSKDTPQLERKVFFKEDTVKGFITALRANSLNADRTQSLFHLSTPWIQVMSHFSLLYQDKIYSLPKEAVESDMEAYIKKHNLDIAKSDISYMAKFIRDPAQKLGKAYQATRKKTK